jgi:hypothetical protein
MAMIAGYWTSQVCGSVACLGLAYHLDGGVATIPNLAAVTSADADGLGRPLRPASPSACSPSTTTAGFR